MARYEGAGWHPSQNFGYPPGTHGRGGESVRLYVQHTTAGGSKLGLRNWFLSANKFDSVAPHFCVFVDGTIDQYVDTDDAAWGCNPALDPDPHIALVGENANFIAINIEWQGSPGVALTEPQFEAGCKLHRWLDKVHPLFRIDHNHIVGHYQINSVDRANDPGPAFPWDRLLATMKENDMTDAQKAELKRVASILDSWQLVLAARAATAAMIGYGVTDSLSQRIADELKGAVDSLQELAK